jgi:two-component system sensor histidine kinase BarA
MNKSPDDAAVYDPVLAAEIAGGNPKIATELLNLLLRELPKQREALNQAFTTDNLKELRELNHKLHGSARYCGTPALIKATSALENTLLSAPPETIAQAVAEVVKEINRLLELKTVFSP